MRISSRYAGFTIIETVIGMAIFVLVSTALYLTFSNILDIIAASQYHSAAADIIESQVELVRNMRYEDVGVVSGAPAGLLPAQQTFTLDGTDFTLRTVVRNIDDPFDGTVGGSPNDTSPADYKLVQFEILCPTCKRFNLGPMTTTVAPKNLESTTKNGSLFVRVFDALGEHPIPDATVTVTNTLVTPHILLTDETNNNGELQLVDIATSSGGYHITATKAGYTSDATWPINDPGNPNPTNPDTTVSKDSLTIATLRIDLVSTVMVHAVDLSCNPVPGMDARLTGAWPVGHNPEVARTNRTLTSGASGTATATVAWDTFRLADIDPAFDIVALSSSLSFDLQAGQTHETTWLVGPASPDTLLVHVVDQNGQPLNDATITASGTFDATQVTGQVSWSETSWSVGSITSATDGMQLGETLTLTGVPGTYATGSPQELISATVDMGAGAAPAALSWLPVSAPANTHIQFQVAANDDNSIWTFVGPDGTPVTFFESSGTALPVSLGTHRYLRYRVLLSTDTASVAPAVQSILIGYRPPCFPPGQTAFRGIPSGDAFLTVSHAGFAMKPDILVPVQNEWQEMTITLTP